MAAGLGWWRQWIWQCGEKTGDWRLRGYCHIVRSLGRWSSHGDTEHNIHDSTNTPQSNPGPTPDLQSQDGHNRIQPCKRCSTIPEGRCWLAPCITWSTIARVSATEAVGTSISLVSMCPAVETINHLAPVWALGTALGSSGSAIIGSRRHC